MGKTYEEAREELVKSLLEKWGQWGEYSNYVDGKKATAWVLNDMFHAAVGWCLNNISTPQTSDGNQSTDFQEKIAACKPALDDAGLRLEALRLAMETSTDSKNVLLRAADYLAFLRGEK